MAHIVWTDKLSVGVDVIDKQHMRIVDYINQLHDAINSSSADQKERIVEIVNDTIDYTESHFGFEETLMEEADYPYLKAHKKVHELFVRKVLDYKKRMDAGDDIATELRETLGRWLINHIKNEDADYARWFANFEEKVPAPIQNEGWLSKQLKRFFQS
ncbi:MAG: bacteriohemerythrin [Betaproteobacteria bacterium]|nr:bacteriohemerythrin [Betaproteobacteria bacterium]